MNEPYINSLLDFLFGADSVFLPVIAITLFVFFTLFVVGFIIMLIKEYLED